MAASVRLTPLQRRGVSAVLASRTAAEAAATVGVSERTVRRWLTDGTFTEAVQQVARDTHRAASASLLAAQRNAVGVLRDALDERSASVRIRAAVALLEYGRHAADNDIDERLGSVERRLRQWYDGYDETPTDDWPALSPAS